MTEAPVAEEPAVVAQPEPAPVVATVAEVAAPAVEAAPASALTSNGRAPNDPREVRRRKREEERLAQEAAERAAAAPAVEAVVAAEPAPVPEAPAQFVPAESEAAAPTVDENLQSVEEVVEHNHKAPEAAHEPKPLA
ncbi:hypothetical protein QNM99_07060 [Pseudomonas sp. PCH446]